MKFLYFHQHFGTPKGAGGIRSYAMAQKLIAKGHSVTMVCGRGARGYTGLDGEFVNGKRYGVVDGIDVIELDLAYSNNMGFLKRVFVFLKFAIKSIAYALKTDCDVIFATSTPLTAGIPGILARWILRRKFVFEVRDLWPELPREMGVITNPFILWMMGVLEFLSYKSAHRIVGLSPGIVEGIERHNIDPSCIAMIPNGCDLNIFDPGLPAWRPTSVEKDDFMAVFTGAHGKANGLDAVLDAAGVLKGKNVDDIKLVLVGDGMEKARLVRRANDERLDNVVFLDLLPKAKLAGLMAGADVGLQVLSNVPAFYYGTSPNKFFDYISSGLPVITNYPGWIADMVNAEKVGWAVPPEDPEAFAEALQSAKNNREDLISRGMRAREMAESKFSRDKLSEQFVEFVSGV